MPAKKKPIELHRHRGTYRRDRHGNPDATTPGSTGPLGDSPGHLDDEHAKVWQELSGSLPDGLAGVGDRVAFELMVRLTLKMRAGLLSAAETGQLRMLLSSFAMVPADRGRVTIPPPRSEYDRALDEFANPYAEFG